jgi:hypothetical protein
VCSLPSNGGDGWSKVQITFRAVGLFLIPSHIHLATGYRYIVEFYTALQTFNASSRIDSEASTFVDQHITRFIIAILTAIVCGLPPAASNYEPQTTFLPRVSSRLAVRDPAEPARSRSLPKNLERGYAGSPGPFYWHHDQSPHVDTGRLLRHT